MIKPERRRSIHAGAVSLRVHGSRARKYLPILFPVIAYRAIPTTTELKSNG